MTAIETDGGGTEQELPRKKLSGKKIVLFIVLPILVIGAAAAGVVFSGILHKGEDEHAEEEETHAAPPAECKGPPAFVDFPDVLVNLNTKERRPQFLKLNIKLELCSALDVPAVTAVLPRITDTFQVYLRELRVDDLNGSAGVYRLREELLMRVNTAAYPTRVQDVLIQEILVQ
ncbi:flagellar basal body-associated FliL family protein [Rhodocista pekingensis]|uniref:Flagellar protein FliL n=1 Tax=Rhodocista pekingensis TaxID=201185 RepID=A0ABW2KR65_9PROT